MFRDIGLEEWLFDDDRTPTHTLVDALFAIHRDASASRRKVGATMKNVHRLRAWPAQTLAAILKRR